MSNLIKITGKLCLNLRKNERPIQAPMERRIKIFLIPRNSSLERWRLVINGRIRIIIRVINDNLITIKEQKEEGKMIIKFLIMILKILYFIIFKLVLL